MHSRIEDNNNLSVTKIFYWNGIIDPQGLSAHYEDILGKLVDGNYQGLDLEKLVGHDVYSVRVNQSDRLLFTTIMVNDQPYLMLLDEVLNHDYAKSRFLKPAVLKYYLELHGKAISEELIRTHFEACLRLNTVPAASHKSKQPIQYSRIDFYNQKYIELDAGQLDVATKKSLPLIISGAPGSGKSCIALLILGQYVESNPKKNDYPILYVTESENLASSMRRAWLALPVAQGLDAKAVQIISYQQLIKELAPKTAQMTFVDKEHCKIWLGNRIKQYANQRKGINTLGKDFFADLDGLYQELRIISVCSDLAAYMALGQRQCLYHEKDEKRWLFSAFTAYQKELEAKACVHAPFYHLGVQNYYKRIVVDEAQDFSHRQLEALSMLACNRQICFCEDNRQSLSDNKSKIPFGPLFNGLYTAFTRATGTIIICQRKHHYLKNIRDELVKAVSGEQATVTHAVTMTPEENQAQWFQQARLQIVQGNVEIAQAIYLDKLHKTPAEFEEFRALYSESAPMATKITMTAANAINRSRPDLILDLSILSESKICVCRLTLTN